MIVMPVTRWRFVRLKKVDLRMDGFSLNFFVLVINNSLFREKFESKRVTVTV